MLACAASITSFSLFTFSASFPPEADLCKGKDLLPKEGEVITFLGNVKTFSLATAAMEGFEAAAEATLTVLLFMGGRGEGGGRGGEGEGGMGEGVLSLRMAAGCSGRGQFLRSSW